ncbi:MAG: SAM-dependent methyltransferase [Elusimicrobiota bacterium]
MSNKLYLLGLGVEPAEHATLEVLQAAGRCDVLYCSGLDAAQRAFLARFAAKGARIADVDGRGSEASLVRKIGAELAAGKTAGLVTPGHPYYWSALGGRLALEAERKKVECRTFGAVSPMGLALAASGVTLGMNVHGMQSFDCRAFVEKKARINLSWPLVIYFYSELDRKTFAAAVKRLAREYGESHPAVWCRAGAAKQVQRVGGLAGGFSGLSAGRVLFLEPKVESKSTLGRTDFHPMKRDDKKAPAWVKQ